MFLFKKIYLSFFLLIIIPGFANAQSWDKLIDSSNGLSQAGNFQQALTLSNQALEQVKKQYGNTSKFIPGILSQLGDIYYYMSNLDKSLEYYKLEGASCYEILGMNNIEYSQALYNIAYIYSEKFAYEQAEPILKEILQIKKTLLGDTSLEYASSLMDLGLLYKNMGNYGEAETYYLKSIELYETQPDSNKLAHAFCLNNLALLEQLMGRYNESEKLYKKVLLITKDMPGINQRAYAQALTNLAGLYSSTNRLQQALALNLLSLNIKLKLLGSNHPQIAITLNNLAGDYEELGNYDLADSLYLKTIKVWQAVSDTHHPNYSSFLANLAELYQRMNRYKESEQLYLQAEKIKSDLLNNQHPDYAHLLSKIAGFYEQKGDYSEAFNYRKKSLDIYIYLLQQSFPYLSEYEKNLYYVAIRVEFEKFYSLVFLHSVDEPTIIGETYNKQLISKSILFNATKKVRERILNSKDSILINKFKHWLQTKEYLSRLERLTKNELKKQNLNIDSLEIIANNEEKSLSLKSELFSYVYDKKNVHWQEIKDVLKKDEAAIEIIRLRKFATIRNKYNPDVFEPGFTDSVYYAVLIITKNTGEEPAVVLIENGNELEKKYLSQYRRAIYFQYMDNDSYNAFWSKIVSKLEGIKKIYISADGVYEQINLNTLYDNKNDKYLLDEYNICSLTNSKDIIYNKSENIGNKNAEFFGNPKFDLQTRHLYQKQNEQQGSLIKLLPGTQKEIAIISELFKNYNWKIKLYLDSFATKQNLMSVHNPGVLHIATHGLFLNDIDTTNEQNLGIGTQYFAENPLLRSMLLLADAENSIEKKNTDSIPDIITPNTNNRNGIFNLRSKHNKTTIDDGIFTALDAMNLELDKTELVVLSACETGLGVVKNGEGVYGLQRAFRTAGAKTILMSLWSVNDEATQELMTTFYKYWLEGESKSQAFRDAQELLKGKYKSPYFWGAFVMLGE